MACVDHSVSTQENSPNPHLACRGPDERRHDNFMDSMPLQSFTLGTVYCDKMNCSVIKSEDVWDQNTAAS